MSDQIRSMPPPLIPLPSPTRHYDPNDPFDDLFSDPGLSRPLFPSVKSKERPDPAIMPPTPPSAASDFGAFISVPAPTDPLHRPPKDGVQDAFSPLTQPPSSSQFFERFTVEAKERTGRNERRVLDELLQHEDDPLYWLNSSRPSHEDGSLEDVSKVVHRDELAPSSPISVPSSRHPTRHENATLPLLSGSPSDSPLFRQNSTPSLASSFTSTLSRKFMSNLLSNSIPSPARTTTPDPSTSPPHFTRPRRDSVTSLTHSSASAPHSTLSVTHAVPSLTHSSPFAPSVHTPPSGAPGFLDDRHWNNRQFEFEVDDEKLHRVELMGRREGTTPVLTNEIADQVIYTCPTSRHALTDHVGSYEPIFRRFRVWPSHGHSCTVWISTESPFKRFMQGVPHGSPAL